MDDFENSMVEINRYDVHNDTKRDNAHDHLHRMALLAPALEMLPSTTSRGFMLALTPHNTRVSHGQELPQQLPRNAKFGSSLTHNY